jgi:hypothetical protein
MQRKWWPLQSALAFCETGDSQFAAHVAATPDSHKTIALDLRMRLKRGVDVDKHWRLLGSLIDDGVRASGTAVDHWVGGMGCRTEEHSPNMLPIGAGDDLVLWDDESSETWLVPHNRLLLGGGGRFWKRVRVCRPDLVAALGGTSKNDAKKATRTKRPPQTEKIIQAFEAALAAGKKRDDMLASPSDLMRIAGAFLRGDKDNEPDPRTFQRVWHQLRDNSP